MNPRQYQDFTDRLVTGLSQNPRVLGVVALGSMAQQDYRPDQYSDHDFFVIVEAGAQPDFRRDLAWLPAAKHIALAFRETEHGLKVVYESGHLLEFAVFDLEELELARTNRYRVLLDRADVGGRMAAITAQTTAEGERQTVDFAYHIGQFLTNLLVGTGRYRRGERLSGHKFVKTSAIHHLLTALAAHLPSPRGALLDNLDATRRFEQAYPTLGAEINALLLQDTESCARGLLALAERELAAVWPVEMERGTAVIRRFLYAAPSGLSE